MTQPRTFRFATDDTYSSGVDIGLPTKVAPDAGRIATGFKRDDYFPCDVANWLLDNIGVGLEGVVDAAALNWTRIADNDGQPNQTHWGVDDDSVYYGQCQAQVAPSSIYANVEADVLVQFNTAKLFLSYDGDNWIDRGLHGISNTGGRARGFAIGIRQDIASTLSIVAWELVDNGQIRKSSNLGDTWSDAGNLPVGFDGDGLASFGGEFNGRFFIAARGQLAYSDNLADVDWASESMVGIWDGSPANPTCFAKSGHECAFGIVAAPGVIRSDGGAWTAHPFPTNPGDGVAALHWCEALSLWVALSAQDTGRILTAPADFSTWTERAPIPGGVVHMRAVTSLGRTVIIAAGNGLWVTHDFVTYRRIPRRLTDDTVSDDAWNWLVKLNGLVWAGRRKTASSETRVEYIMSGTLPDEFNKVMPW